MPLNILYEHHSHEAGGSANRRSWSLLERQLDGYCISRINQLDLCGRMKDSFVNTSGSKPCFI